MPSQAPAARRALLPAVAVLLVLGSLGGAVSGQPPPPDAAPAHRAALGHACDTPAPTRFDVVALRIPVAYNHWGDFDPEGRLFVRLDELPQLLLETEAMLATSVQDAASRELENALDATKAALAEAGLVPPVPPAGDPEDPLIVKAGNATRIAENATGEALREGPALDVVRLAKPLIVRAHVGDCVEFHLTNALPEPVSLHVHAARTPPGQGGAVGVNDPDLTLPGRNRTYRAVIPAERGMEGAHFLHSHADARYQTKHGLFGALVAEPPGTMWTDPERPGVESASGESAIIATPDDGDPATKKYPDFREYVLIYHDEVELLDRTLSPLPVVGQYGEYAPGSKAINLRTEPFQNRFKLHDALFDEGKLPRGFDKSQAYGSYSYGDPGVFIPRAYVGDPTKFRLLNAGPGQHHLHHLHGGGDRWRASPVSDATQIDLGLRKDDQTDRADSTRIDVQSIGPGESFNAEIEGGAGGTQQGAGDYLFHCHIVEHYVGGMWSFWRVYNTRNPTLAELPDRAGWMDAPVNSTTLRTHPKFAHYGLDDAEFQAWVESQLPPRGEPNEDDASVWNWSVNDTAAGLLYRGEPETKFVWPNYRSATPGVAPEILFNASNGRLSYPHLSPHLGKRPPFAPGHGPAPYLQGAQAPDASKGDRDALCTPGSLQGDRHRAYNVVAIGKSITYAPGETDPAGQIFVQAKYRADVEQGLHPARNLMLRANLGDCVDLTLTSKLPENDENHHHSKVNMHIHLVQFDPQASDGVITGLQYEQSVRPVDSGSLVTRARAPAALPNGHWRFPVDSVAPFLDAAHAPKIHSAVGVGLTEDRITSGRLVALDPVARTIDLEGPFPAGRQPSDYDGDYVGYEFVRYRWFPDVELGIVYWHDHVDGINGWRHGLFGTIIIEPRSSTWLDSKVPEREIDEGSIAIINASTGAFREFVVEVQDRSGCTGAAADCSKFVGAKPEFDPPNRQAEMASLNLRSKPLVARGASLPLATTATDEAAGTDVWEAYAGDPVMVRLLYAGQSTSTGVGTFAITGHRFPAEPFNPGSRLVDAVSVGISTHANLRLEDGCGAGGCGRQAGDYLYGMTQPDLLDRGAWGVFRVYGPGDAAGGLQPVPGTSPAGRAPVPWPTTAPDGSAIQTHRFNVTALAVPVTYHRGLVPATVGTSQLPALPVGVPVDPGAAERALPTNVTRNLKIFALDDEVDDILAGRKQPMPLVLRAAEGEIVEVRVTNRLSEPVTLSPALVRGETLKDLGLPVGRNPTPTDDQRVAANGGSYLYRWYADRAVGAVYLSSLGKVGRGSDGAQREHSLEGLYGALVVEPDGSQYRPDHGMSADLVVDGRPAREHVLLYASEDPFFEASVMPYNVEVDGVSAVNYRAEPVHARTGAPGLHACTIDPENCLQARLSEEEAATTGNTAINLALNTVVQTVKGLPGGGVTGPVAEQAAAKARKLVPLLPYWAVEDLPEGLPVQEVRNPANPWATSSLLYGDPQTPVLDAVEGEGLVIRALGASGDQLQVHHLAGHWWPADPEMQGADPAAWRSNLVDAQTLGPREVLNAWSVAGPGGAGDYAYGTHRDAHREAGQWGILRVSAARCPQTSAAGEAVGQAVPPLGVPPQTVGLPVPLVPKVTAGAAPAAGLVGTVTSRQSTLCRAEGSLPAPPPATTPPLPTPAPVP